ncbi:hypothetical protein COO60DRAFT_375062 [Scenedesmus sp. NREL 46B-D3]|nr:hypothetical protein COO60DRAFT_375062 [Scenedesmus sp. NREL 46B-D3]
MSAACVRAVKCAICSAHNTPPASLLQVHTRMLRKLAPGYHALDHRQSTPHPASSKTRPITSSRVCCRRTTVMLPVPTLPALLPSPAVLAVHLVLPAHLLHALCQNAALLLLLLLLHPPCCPAVLLTWGLLLPALPA